MLTRRLIRVKVFKELFGKVVQGTDSLMQAEKELIASCGKTVLLPFGIAFGPKENC